MNITNQKIIFDFDTSKYNFADLFRNHLSSHNVFDLQKLHIQLTKNLLNDSVVTSEDDQSVPIYKILYDIFDSNDLTNRNPLGNFLSTYKEFIYYLSDEIFHEKLVYQKSPTLRVQFPGNKAVFEFHRDRDYNHPVEEINIWIPVTPAFNTNTIWMESEFDKEDYSPVNLIEGEGLIFDSGLKHGNKINTENLTRLSFDFRVIPLSKWDSKKHLEGKKSFNKNLEFKIDSYYDEMS
ncbi:hypothetical protein N9I58_02280 [Candidatus Thioglobus sp.]|nr:hypothetical protein [Candidatus Thioglobus sp.]